MPKRPIDRLPIKSALFNLAEGITFPTPINGFTTWQLASRRLKLWNAVDKDKQPAMFLVQHREGYMSYGVGLQRRYLDMGFWCYAPTGMDGVIGDDLLDIMELGFETALMPDDPSRNELTLNGLCYWCRITREEGMFIRDPGDIDGQALLILPVRILLP